MELKITKNIDELSRQVADWMVDYIAEILKASDRFTVALSGGNTPARLFRLLASNEYKNKIDWTRLHFFWGDERFVPFSDERNNAKMAFENLLDHVPAVKENIYIMRTDLEPEASAMAYEKLLHSYFPGNQSFDLVLLGLGDDAHTLSLFPGNPIIQEKNSWVKTFYLEAQKMYRITLTAPVVNAAGRVAFLVSGGGKAAALYHVMAGEHDPAMYPSQIIQPYNDALYWWVDEAAAADLS